jgi:hypothetical protein
MLTVTVPLLPTVTIAEPDFVESAREVAVTAIELGLGALLGAVNTPLPLTLPHDVVAQATLHTTD